MSSTNYDMLDKSVSSSSLATPRERLHFISQPDDTLSSRNLWESTDYPNIFQLDDSSFRMSLLDSTTTIDPRADDGSSAPSIWDSTTCVDPSFLIRDNDNGDHVKYWTTSIDCGCSTRHIQIRTKGTDPSSYDDVKILTFGPSAAAADPYANNLRIETTCVVAALHTIVMHLGIDQEIICADESLSPFFRSTAGSVGADYLVRANMIKTVQQTFKRLKPDLRPSSEQITIKHHPCIDILPFPTLRKNVIIHQEELDEDELFSDIFTGLVCWGGAGIGKRDLENNTGYASTGTPWDVRSWEAKAWFLKKYWALLGGEDGELVRQSEWWRSIRGEDMPCIEVLS